MGHITTELDASLRLNLYHLTASLAAKRRGLHTWLESAALHTSSSQCTLVLRICCSWSSLFVEVFIDYDSTLVFCDGQNEALMFCLHEVNESSRGEERIPKVIAAVMRAINRESTSVWPVHRPVADERSAIEILLRSEVAQLASVTGCPNADRGRRDATIDVLQGAGVMVGLLTSAFQNVRRPVVCKPVPHWLLRGAGAGPGSPLASPGGPHAVSSVLHSPQEHTMDFDEEQMAQAIAVMPHDLLQLLSPDGNDIDSEALHALPLPALLLLYWLLCLCPARLIRLPSPVGDATASFEVIHGPCPRDAGARSSPLWNAEVACRHGTYGNTWWHGTATDNGYAILCYGLRSLSTTRHSSSGAIFGDGVYVTNDLKVAHQFTAKKGVVWAGMETALAGSASGQTAPLAKQGVAVSVACRQRLVLELDVLADSRNKIVVAGRDVSATARPGPDGDSSRWNIPGSCYLVVPDDSCLWIRRLHVYQDKASDVAVAGAAPSGSSPVAALLVVVFSAMLALWLRFYRE